MLLSTNTIIKDVHGNVIGNIKELSIKFLDCDVILYVNYLRYKTDEKGILQIQQNNSTFFIMQKWESILLSCKTNQDGLEIIISEPQWMSDHKVEKKTT